jgi:selenocysteine lyase/cysteine desulfurase
VRNHLRLLNGHVFASPYTHSPAAQAATALADRARICVRSFFNAAPDDYAVIFTATATGALRLVGEAYPFMPEGHLLLCADNHNSVNGIRELRARDGRR